MALLLLTNIFLYYVLYFIAPVFGNDDTKNIVSYTFKLLDEGEEKINLLENVTNFTMVIGNTGSGKSTLVQWLAECHTDTLVSKEVKDGTGEYIIEDGNFRIGSSTASKTLFPELVFDNKSNIAYYDCPGFSSTRSTSEDIASSFFIKKIADHGKFVKILLVTGYPSVRKGVDRMNFMKLLRHVTQLIKNIDKFEDSIAIAITKVDNIYVKNSGKLNIVSDEKVVNTIADFLQSVIEDLHEKLLDFPEPENNKDFCLNAIKLVKMLLKERNGTYTRIGIFRRPEVPGPLSESSVLKEGKETLVKIVLHELRFTNKNETDFRYSISEESMNDINKLLNKINENVWYMSMEVESELLTYYRFLAENIRNKVHSFLNNNVVVTNVSEGMKYNTQLTMGYEILSNITMRNSGKTLTDFLQLGIAIQNISRTFGLQSTEKYVNLILTQGKYFSFFQLVSKENAQARDFSQVFLSTEINFKLIKDEVLRKIAYTIDIMNKTRSFEIDQIVMNFKSYFETNGNVNDVEETISKLGEGVSVISTLISAMENSTSVQQILMLISKSILDSDLPTINLSVNIISHIETYMEYLSAFIPNMRFHLEIYSLPFIELNNYLINEKCWYEFVKHLYELFSKYDIQCSKTLYNVANIEQWGRAGQQQGIHVHKHNFHRFLDTIQRYNISHFQIIKEINMSERKFTELADVLNELLVATPAISCGSEGYIYVTGYIVKLSDIVDSKGSIKELCKNSARIRSLFIYAAHVIFIDNDIIATGLELQITIAAPTWHIIGNRIINLDGHSGVNIDPPRASDGPNAGDNGEDGLPGGSGGHGGHFLGITDVIVNGSNLTISANGGNGGNGQNGGNGANGQDGLWAESNSNFRSTTIDNDFFLIIIYSSDLYFTKYFGKPGKRGGAGGNGGAGGIGGKRGKIKVITNRQVDPPIQIASDGSTGFNGIGGLGGAGGSPGKDLYACECERRFLIFYFTTYGCCKRAYLPASAEYGETGPNGIDGSNIQGRIELNEPIKFINEADSVIWYKELLYKNLGSRFTKRLLKHLEALNNNIELIKMYECPTILNELKVFEKYFFKMKTISESTEITLYQSLLDRLDTFISNHSFRGNLEACKMALSYGKAAIIGRLYNLKQIATANHVFDLKAYLGSAYQNIESLKIINDGYQQKEFVENYISYYKNKLSNKLQEAEYFINTHILPKVDYVNSQILIQLEYSIQGTLDLQIQDSVPEDRLLHQKWKLQNVLTSVLFSSVLEIIGKFVDCFGSVRPIVDLFIGSAVMDYEPPQSVLNASAFFESKIIMFRSKVNTLQNLKFNNVKKQLQKLNVTLHELPQNIRINFNDIIDEYELDIILAQKTFNLNELQDAENRFHRELLQRMEALEMNSQNQNYFKLIETLSMYFEAPLRKVVTHIYSAYHINPQNISLTFADIHYMIEKIDLFSKNEYDIHKTMIPTLKAMTEDLDIAVDALKKKSKLKFDIKRWNVQGALMDIKHKVQLYTKNHKLEAPFPQHIENLKEAITTLINIYDRIQNFVAQNNLAEYIADMSSARTAMTEQRDQEIINLTNQLEIIIRSNLILLQYKDAINALTQHVFPFANIYLYKNVLSLQVATETNFQNIVEKSLKHIAQLIAELNDNTSSVYFPDNGIRVGWFSSDFVSSEPFFVWRNIEFKDLITTLLMGEKILLKADVLKAQCQKEAIKFRTINLKLKAKNKSINEEIQKKLQGYILNATHMGNSYYKFNKREYVITSDSQSILLSYEKHKNGLLVYRNDVYSKIETGYITLSPYTMWEFQLIKTADNLNFNELLKYSSLVDLELEGFGSYVYDSRNASYEDTSLYYKEVGVIWDEISFDKYPFTDFKITNVSLSNVEY